MKSVITLSVVALMAVTAHAETAAQNAATTKATATTVAKNKKHKRKGLKNEATTDAGSTVSGEGAAEAPAASLKLNPSQTSTTSVSESKLKTILNRFTATANAESYGGFHALNSAKGDVETDYTLAVGYKVNDKTSVKVQLETDQMNGFNGNSTNSNGGNYWVGFQDPYVGVSRSNIVKSENGTTVNAQARYYAPLSPDSKQRDQLAHIRLYGVVQTPVAKNLSASLTLSPRFFIQKKDNYTTTSGLIRPTDNFRFLTSAGLKYTFSDKWAVEQTLGLYQKWWNGSRGTVNGNKQGNFLDASTSVYYSPIKWVELNAGIRQSDEATDINQSSGKNNGIYAADQAEYFLIATLSI